MPSKKIVCLGGGSGYFAGALGDLAIRKGLKGSEIVLYDIDIERAKLMARCGMRLSSMAGADFKIYATRDLQEALYGVHFAIGNIGGIGGGGGGFHKTGGVHVKDFLISAKYGIYQVVGDTGGPAAMMAAFRTIPIYLNIFKRLGERCLRVIFVNHANPMAILCRAMNKYAGLKGVIGICHGVQGGVNYIAEILKVPAEELDTIWIGTNHYYWFTEIYHRGKNIYPELRRRMTLCKPPSGYTMHARLSNIFGYQIVYPDDSHIIEFYPYLSQVKDGDHLPYGIPKSHHGVDVTKMYAAHGLAGRGKKIKEKSITRRMILKDFNEHLDRSIKDFANRLNEPEYGAHPHEKVDEDVIASMERKMAFVESVGSLIEAIALGRRKVHIVNIPNKGAVPNLPHTAVLEIEGVTDSCGIRGLHMAEAPLALKGQLEKMIAWQELVVDAAVKGDKNLALQALMLDPMAILPEKAEKMLDELLANSKELLPQFK